MERIRPKADGSLGWAFRPDDETREALARGADKVRKHPELGGHRPHVGQTLEAARDRIKEARRRRKKQLTIRRRQVAKRVVSRKKTAAPSKKKTVVKEASTGKLIPLKTICAELDLDPKATRVKLRRMIANDEIDFHDHSSRWEFTKAQANQIRQALSE